MALTRHRLDWHQLLRLGAYPVAATDGYIDLKIKDESNAQINALYNNSVQDSTALVAGPYTVLKNFVDNQPWFWGTGLAAPSTSMLTTSRTTAMSGTPVHSTATTSTHTRSAPTLSVQSPPSTR